MKVKNVAILVYDDMELHDFAGPSEVLQLAEYNGKKAFNVYTVGVPEHEITSQKIVKIRPRYSIENCPHPDILVMPGGDTRQAGKRFVDNGRIITTEGILAGIDGARYLVEKMFDKNASKDIAEYMMYNWKPESFNVYIKR